MRYRTHSSAGPLASEIEDVAKGCPPPDTRLRATIYWDQVGGEDILQWSTSEQHYFHLFSAAGVALSTQGSFYGESASFGTRLRGQETSVYLDA